MKIKRVLALLLCAVLCLGVLAGCGEGQAPDDGSSSNEAASGWAKIEQAGKLVVGLDDTFAPMGFRDESGNLVGFDIDMATEVGQLLGVEVVFQPIDWKTKESALESGRIDCLWNGLSKTPKRIEEMAMTKRYLQNRLIIMALDANVKVESAADLANVKIGTQADSAALETMQGHEAWDTFKDNVATYDDYDQALMDMQAGRVDCIVIDEVLGNYKNTKLTEKMTECSFNFGDDFYAVGCRKADTDLAEKINGAFQTLIGNGKAAEISVKWFGKDVVMFED